MPRQLLNIYDYELEAAERMDPIYHAYYAGGVAENISRDESRTAYDRLRLRPRMLRDVSQVSTECTVMGKRYGAPLMVAPTATHKMAHPEGEMATARAAKRRNLVQVLSTMANSSIEDVAGVGHDVWYQLYVFRDRSLTEEMVARAEAAGAKALAVTVDVPALGLRENLVRVGFSGAPQHGFPNFAKEGDSVEDFAHHAANNFDPSLSWKDIDWLASKTKLPIWIKGVLRGDDAAVALGHGVKGIMVSNHGGRQLDTAIAPIDALPDVVEAVDGRCEVLVDGGVRRGTDVIKALARGARAVMLGRPVLWGLAVNGEEGVADVLEKLRLEFENGMMQCGCRTLEDIGPDLVV